MFALWFREARKEWMVYSDPLPLPNELVYYKPKSIVVISTSVEDLKHLVFGYVHGYAYPEEFSNANFRKRQSYTNEENIWLLVSGGVDIIIADKFQTKYFLNKLHRDKANLFEALSPPLKTDSQYLVISKKRPDNQQIILDFNKGLKQITRDGTLDKIKALHGF